MGAGAAGLTCAAEAASRGLDTLVLERGPGTARKVRIAGGGGCNLTNLELDAGDYLCANPHFAKSALARFTPWQAVDLLHKGGLDTVEPHEPGRIFCAQGAEAVADWLEERARQAGARIRLETAVLSVRQRDGGGFLVETSGGEVACDKLVVASGGPAWPQAGATPDGYAVCRSLRLEVIEPRPALVPLRAAGPLKPVCRELSGVSARVAVHLDTPPPRPVAGNLLFTHTGLSGPAALDASLFLGAGEHLVVDWLPGLDLARELAGRDKMLVRNALARPLPKRLAAALCRLLGWNGTLGDLGADWPEKLDALHRHDLGLLPPDAWAKAEVTAGGVDTRAISSKTMEAQSVAGLFVVGECLDVTGRLGGYNLHWALASGMAAGQSV